MIVDWFYDAAVSGADPIEVRPGFAQLLARIADNGVRTIIVETRFARDLMVQEVGYAMLRGLGVTLVAADSPSSFLWNVTFLAKPNRFADDVRCWLRDVGPPKRLILNLML